MLNLTYETTKNITDSYTDYDTNHLQAHEIFISV